MEASDGRWSLGKVRLVRILNEYEEVFPDGPGLAKGVSYKLNTKEQVSFNQCAFPVPQSKIQAMQEELDRMLKGTFRFTIFKPSSSGSEKLWQCETVFMWWSHEQNYCSRCQQIVPRSYR